MDLETFNSSGSGDFSSRQAVFESETSHMDAFQSYLSENPHGYVSDEVSVSNQVSDSDKVSDEVSEADDEQEDSEYEEFNEQIYAYQNELLRKRSRPEPSTSSEEQLQQPPTTKPFRRNQPIRQVRHQPNHRKSPPPPQVETESEEEIIIPRPSVHHKPLVSVSIPSKPVEQPVSRPLLSAKQPVIQASETIEEAPRKKKDRKKKLPKPLTNIVARQGQDPIDYIEVLRRFKIGGDTGMNLEEFMQASPDAAKNFRRLTTRENFKKRRSIETLDSNLTFVQTTSSELELVHPDRRHLIQFESDQLLLPQLNSKEISSNSALLGPRNDCTTIGLDKSHSEDFPATPLLVRTADSDKHFRVSGIAFISHESKPLEIVIGTSYCLVDQGSDGNIISQVLADELNCTRYPILKHAKIMMGVASGGKHGLKEYTTLDFTVEGIHRIIHLFIQPNVEKGKGNTRMLLLGLPWLYTVKGVIDVHKSTFTIGDEDLHKQRATIQTPKLQQSSSHQLILYSTNPKYKVAVLQAEMQIKLEIASRHLSEENKNLVRNKPVKKQVRFETSASSDSSISSGLPTSSGLSHKSVLPFSSGSTETESSGTTSNYLNYSVLCKTVNCKKNRF